MQKRTTNCIKELRNLGLDAIVVSDPINVTYLTGFRNAQGYLLMTTSGEIIYFTNFIYLAQAKQKTDWQVISKQGNIFQSIANKITELKLKKIGFEGRHMPHLEYQEIVKHLSAKIIATVDLVKNLRAIKDNKEITLIRKSAQITTEAIEFIRQIHDQSMSEKTLAIEVEKFLRLKGDNQVAFPSIVAAGKSSAFPHHLPSEENQTGNFFITDLGSKYYGYCADLTRVFFWGKMPALLKRVYETVLKAQQLAIKRVRAGVKASQVDGAAREFIEKKGYGKFFGHGLGHGLGLDVHEPPYLSPYNEKPLKEGMVITIEPAIYLPSKFGIRIEDMVLVRKNKGEIISGNPNR
ncbi:MAG: aminopeptidase P family protein [Candidatus Omnitrophica bacterium]|nr:aminopeptidase P family protein [Candidatus Omnitrophota bacterium]